MRRPWPRNNEFGKRVQAFIETSGPMRRDVARTLEANEGEGRGLTSVRSYEQKLERMVAGAMPPKRETENLLSLIVVPEDLEKVVAWLYDGGPAPRYRTLQQAGGGRQPPRGGAPRLSVLKGGEEPARSVLTLLAERARRMDASVEETIRSVRDILEAAERAGVFAAQPSAVRDSRSHLLYELASA